MRWRRALVIQASAGGNTVPVIARLVQTSEDRVLEMIHRFNDMGMASLDPQWAGGRPRRITTDDEAFIVATTTARPESLGRPFTRWSLRKLADYLADNDMRALVVCHERLRQILDAHDVTFQRTKRWKESNDPDRDAKLERIEEVLDKHPDRCFAFDEFGALAIRPVGGSRVGASGSPAASAGELPQDPRRAAVPRLLLGRRRRAVGRGPPSEVRGQHARRPAVNPGPAR